MIKQKAFYETKWPVLTENTLPLSGSDTGVSSFISLNKNFYQTLDQNTERIFL